MFQPGNKFAPGRAPGSRNELNLMSVKKVLMAKKLSPVERLLATIDELDSVVEAANAAMASNPEAAVSYTKLKLDALKERKQLWLALLEYVDVKQVRASAEKELDARTKKTTRELPTSELVRLLYHAGEGPGRKVGQKKPKILKKGVQDAQEGTQHSILGVEDVFREGFSGSDLQTPKNEDFKDGDKDVEGKADTEGGAGA